jgi:hypothetical protein
VVGVTSEGVVLYEQIKNLDFTVRDISFICKASDDVVQTVQKNVLTLVMK